MLFEDKERTRTGPMLQGELEYAYYDSSARPPYAIYRALINGWIERLPEAERAEAVARFRGAANASYQAALAELVIHESSLQQGFTPELHPLGAHPTRRLDFLVRTNNQAVAAYIEVTSINPTPEWVARNNQEAAIYNAIDKVALPAGWRLGYAVERRGQNNPNLNTLKTQIEAWAEASTVNAAEEIPTRLFDAADWQIELTLFGGFDPSVKIDRAIVTAAGELRILQPDRKICQALELKGNRYGALDAPYLIVVADNKDELPGGNHNATALLDAVFGSVVARFAQQDDGQMIAHEERQHNGYWGVNGNPRHRNVGGVVLLPKPNLWHLRDERSQPLIVRNPWATHQLPDDFFPLPSFDITDAGDISLTEGQPFADLIGLPNPWPPEG